MPYIPSQKPSFLTNIAGKGSLFLSGARLGLR